MAIFWLFLYVFVNLTSILYLGQLPSMVLLPGHEYLHTVMIALAIFAVIITLWWHEGDRLYRCNTGDGAYHWWVCYHLYGVECSR